jgi:hypothetical protein
MHDGRQTLGFMMLLHQAHAAAAFQLTAAALLIAILSIRIQSHNARMHAYAMFVARNQLGETPVVNTGFFETVMEMSARQFKRNFRMDKSTFLWLEKRLWWEHTKGYTRVGARRVQPIPAPGRRVAGRRRAAVRRSVPSLDDVPEWDADGPARAHFTRRVLMTVHWLATGCTYREVGLLFGERWVDYDTFVVSLIAGQDAKYVRWPRFGEEQDRVKAEFRALRGFDGCLGAIDGSYIPILAPNAQAANAAEFNTRKMFYAIQLEAVALPNLLFTHAYTGWPGSRTDAHVLKFSSLYRRTRDLIPAGCYLLGDAGYPLLSWLMTPFSKKSVAQDATCGDYNFNQASSRVVVEQAFGVLKSRFRILRGMEVRLDKVRAAPRVRARTPPPALGKHCPPDRTTDETCNRTGPHTRHRRRTSRWRALCCTTSASCSTTRGPSSSRPPRPHTTTPRAATPRAMSPTTPAYPTTRHAVPRTPRAPPATRTPPSSRGTTSHPNTAGPNSPPARALASSTRRTPSRSATN